MYRVCDSHTITLVTIRLILCAAAFHLGPAQCVFAQDAGQEPAAIVELGAAVSRSLSDSESSFGPTVAVEFTPIEKWLEVEAGITSTFGHHSTEWEADFLFKKPWDLAKRVEFMAGIGPAWVHTKQSGMSSNAVAGEAVLDFMFWPSAKRKFGWYVEPGYEYSFGRGHERSFGVSFGLLIAIR